jgi:hypothetical protein
MAKKTCRNRITLVERPEHRAIAEEEMRFDVLFDDEKFSELYFNTRGFQATHGLPCPSTDGEGRVTHLQMGERSLGTFKREIAKLNREWKQLEGC